MIGRLGYLRAGAVAKPYGVSQRTVRRWIAAGVLPSIKIGGTCLRHRSRADHGEIRQGYEPS